MIARISRFHIAIAAIDRLGAARSFAICEGKPYIDCQADDTAQTATARKSAHHHHKVRLEVIDSQGSRGLHKRSGELFYNSFVNSEEVRTS
jgi:hypothetical protein